MKQSSISSLSSIFTENMSACHAGTKRWNRIIKIRSEEFSKDSENKVFLLRTTCKEKHIVLPFFFYPCEA